MHHVHSARRRGPIHRARIFPLPNTHLHIIKYAYSFHRKHISVPHFVDIYGYEGTINRPLRLLTVCQQRCEQIEIMWQIFCEISTSNHKMHHEHTARRRGRFIVPVSLHCQIRIFTLLNTCIRFIANTFLFVILWIYTDMRAR